MGNLGPPLLLSSLLSSPLSSPPPPHHHLALRALLAHCARERDTSSARGSADRCRFAPPCAYLILALHSNCPCAFQTVAFWRLIAPVLH